MVKLGDRGLEVSRVQKYLSLYGYDLIVDGVFGKKTERSLKAFQKKFGLVVDGIAGPKTMIALEAAQKRTAKEDKSPSVSKDYGDIKVETGYHLPPEQYIRQKHKKTQIFIHFTASGPIAKSVINYWDSNSERVAAPFVINGRDGVNDGLIHQCFNPDHWGFHLGIKGTNGRLDKASVGIEICNWGRLDKKGDKFYSWTKTEVSSDEVYELDKEWRGRKYYQKYSDRQIEELEKLILWIVKEYDIPVQKEVFDRNWAEYNKDVITKTLPGIWTHTNVRKDKQDTYPDQRIFDMLNRISKKVNG
jgi:N-acetyl-anhydromuramyl-L-alanine amidase AmpD